MLLKRVFAGIVVLSVVLACGGFLTPTPARAQKQEPPIVAVLDVEKIKRDAAASASIRDAITSAKERFEAQLREEGEGLKAEEEQLRKQQTILAPDAFAAKRRDLEQRYADLRRRVQETGNVLARARSRAYNTLLGEMYKVLAEQMKDQHISMILARGSVLVYDERMNITDVVLKELDARMPNVEVTFEPSKQ